MTELPFTRQIPGEGRRRWFADDYFDLIVWHKGDEITGFQLCYDRDGSPRAYTWTTDHGRSHLGIDDGDDVLLTYKATPILVADGAFDVAAVKQRFVAAADRLPAEIRGLVLVQLEREEQRDPSRSARDGAPVAGRP